MPQSNIDQSIVISFSIPNCRSWDQPVRKVLTDRTILFNEATCSLIGIRDKDYGRNFEICIHHKDLPINDESAPLPIFDIDIAKEKFPFLFKP